MKDLQVCFIGTGWMGSSQIKKLAQMEGISISVVINDKIDQAKNVLKEIGLDGVDVLTDLEYALANYPIDIVWIVSPNSFHGYQSILAMEKGKHVFCEKPPATTYQEFSRQIALANSNPKLKTLVNYVLYFNPMEQALLKLVEQNAFGVIHQIQVNYRHPVNIEGDKAWKLKKEIVGDALGMGINHAVSVIVHIMSRQTKPVAVYATSCNPNIRGFEPDPVWNIMIRFKNGATATCLGTIDHENGYDLYHNIAGSKGGFIFDSRVELENKIRLWGENITDGKWVYPLRDQKATRFESLQDFYPDMMLPDSGNVIDHQVSQALEHFIDSVRTGVDSPLSFAHTEIIGEIGWAAQISAKFHREVALPLTDEDKKHASEL